MYDGLEKVPVDEEHYLFGRYPNGGRPSWEEAVEDLRGYVDGNGDIQSFETEDTILRLADDIERMVELTTLPRPVDAGGLPIRFDVEYLAEGDREVGRIEHVSVFRPDVPSGLTAYPENGAGVVSGVLRRKPETVADELEGLSRRVRGMTPEQVRDELTRLAEKARGRR